MVLVEKGTNIHLTWDECKWAAEIGSLRQIESRKKGLNRHKDGYRDDDRWERDIEGALAELAVTKALGIKWNAGVNTFKKADCGLDLQVRQSGLDHACLIVRPSDSEDDRYVLVTGRIPLYKICGSMLGKTAKGMDQYIRSPRGRPAAWFIPQHELGPLRYEDGG